MTTRPADFGRTIAFDYCSVIVMRKIHSIHWFFSDLRVWHAVRYFSIAQNWGF